MSTADAPLARLCSRQTCRRPARTTLTFVYSDSTAVIGPLSVHAEPHAYDLCIPHAQRMTPPRGWEIVRLEGIPAAQDDDAPAPASGGPVADSAPLAPLSALPTASASASASHSSAPARPVAVPQPQERPADVDSAGGPSDSPAGGQSAESPEADAPGNAAGSAPRGWGRRRRARLRAVASPAAESHADPASGAAAAGGTGADDPAEDSAAAAQQAPVQGREPDHGSRAHDRRADDLHDDHDRDDDRDDDRADDHRPGDLHADDRSADGRPDGVPEADVGPESGGAHHAAARPGGFDSLTDEIFAGEGTEYVLARAGSSAQPLAMRRPHLRRGRR